MIYFLLFFPRELKGTHLSGIAIISAFALNDAINLHPVVLQRGILF
jgi:hypothetical protein